MKFKSFKSVTRPQRLQKIQKNNRSRDMFILDSSTQIVLLYLVTFLFFRCCRQTSRALEYILILLFYQDSQKMYSGFDDFITLYWHQKLRPLFLVLQLEMPFPRFAARLALCESYSNIMMLSVCNFRSVKKDIKCSSVLLRYSFLRNGRQQNQ